MWIGRMTNPKLNFGGIFGGAVCAVAVLYLLSNQGQIPPRSYKLIALAAFGGAALGNWIWRLSLPREPQDP
jgi:hypothetical protein